MTVIEQTSALHVTMTKPIFLSAETKFHKYHRCHNFDEPIHPIMHSQMVLATSFFLITALPPVQPSPVSQVVSPNMWIRLVSGVERIGAEALSLLLRLASHSLLLFSPA
jgi:hypothetical protein